MKSLARNLIATVLGWQVRRLRRKNNFKVVAVAGSIGKTSTKRAVATVLSEKFLVISQSGNYNHEVSVPLVFFGLSMPKLTNPFSWIRAISKIETSLKKPYEYDLVVLELGTDKPGDIAKFKSYLRVDIGIITAITPEHMLFFDDLDAVASEELSLAEFSDTVIINSDLINEKYSGGLPEKVSFGTGRSSIYRMQEPHISAGRYSFEINGDGRKLTKGKIHASSRAQLYSFAAAAVAGDMLGLNADEITSGLRKITPVNGRMNRLEGLNGSLILDDTYNASPDAVIASLDTLYDFDVPRKIALLGNMNELGRHSQEAHEKVGRHCDPKELDLVIALGKDASRYLAPAAAGNGCRVAVVDTPFEAAAVIKRENLTKDTVILAKGSQNKVFAEEAVKLLLFHHSDRDKLVRQTPEWLKKKADWLGPLESESRNSPRQINH